MPMPTTDTMVTKPPVKNLEWRIVQAYVSLGVARIGTDVACAATIARCGSYELRLVEHTSIDRDDAVPFWLELFDHKSSTSLDSFGSHRLEEVTAAAKTFLSTAKPLRETEST